MSSAFIVLVHRDPNTLRILLDELRPHPTFIHVDAHAQRSGRLGPRDIPADPNVIVSPESQCVHWGGFTVLKAMLRTLEYALEETIEGVDQFTFLSGQCYPLRPVDEFVEFLRTTPRPVLCRAYDLSEGDVHHMATPRVTRRHWMDGAPGHLKKMSNRHTGEVLRRTMATLTRPWPVSVPAQIHACGSQWVSVPRPLAIELVAHYRNGGFNYLRNSFAPDEMAIQSYVHNTEWSRLTPAGGLEPFSALGIAKYPNYHWLRTALKGELTNDDLAPALASKQFFARKMPALAMPQLVGAIHSSW